MHLAPPQGGLGQGRSSLQMRGRHAPAATLHWGPHGTTLVAQPQGGCWASTQHIPNAEIWGPKPFLGSSHPKLPLGLSPVVRQSWPLGGAQATRVWAATCMAGGGLAPLLAPLNIRALANAKPKTCPAWVRVLDVECRGANPQKARANSGPLVPTLRCHIPLGPCSTDTGPDSRPPRPRGCGWLVGIKWGPVWHSQPQQGWVGLVPPYFVPPKASSRGGAHSLYKRGGGREGLRAKRAKRLGRSPWKISGAIEHKCGNPNSIKSKFYQICNSNWIEYNFTHYEQLKFCIQIRNLDLVKLLD